MMKTKRIVNTTFANFIENFGAYFRNIKKTAKKIGMMQK